VLPAREHFVQRVKGSDFIGARRFRIAEDFKHVDDASKGSN
jgi:hypothetical protein